MELARRYFQWTGPATLAEFQWFSDLGVKAAKAAVEPLHLVESEGARLLPPDLADNLSAFKIQKEPIYALIGSIDSVLLLRRDLKSMIDGEDFRSLVQASAAVSNSAVWRNSPATRSSIAGVSLDFGSTTRRPNPSPGRRLESLMRRSRRRSKRWNRSYNLILGMRVRLAWTVQSRELPESRLYGRNSKIRNATADFTSKSATLLPFLIENRQHHCRFCDRLDPWGSSVNST